MRFTATAEHCSGQSIDHPCTTGIWSDPTDHWQTTVDADTLETAQCLAQADLESSIRPEPCNCRRKLTAGGNSWWESVAIHLWPQDESAMVAWLANGGEPNCDSYNLIPAHLKPVAVDE